MLKFIKAKPATEFIGRKEWWEIGDHCEALIGFGKNLRSINIRDAKGNDVTSIVAKQLDIKLVDEENIMTEVRLNRTIDAFLIECPEELLVRLLKQVDFVCQNIRSLNLSKK